MANFNVYLQVGVAKGAMAVWSYNSSTSGVGTSSGNPLDVEIGDTVTFISHASSIGYARVHNLSIFTSNADIEITSAGGSVVRTVASGGLTADTVTGLNGGQTVTDLFYFERQAAASDTTPNAYGLSNRTNANLSTVYSTYAQITGIDTATAVTISGSGTFSISSTTSPGSYGTSGNISNNQYLHVRNTSSGSYSTGVSTTTTVGGVTSTYTITTKAVTAPDASISAITSPNLAYGSTTHAVTIAGGNSVDQYYVYNNTGSVSYGGRTGNGTITITHGVSAGSAATFRVYARRPVAAGGDNGFDDTGTTFEVEVYPNSTVLSVSSNNPSSASVTATLSATGGQGGTIEYAKTSYSSTTAYAQNRGTTVTYYARSVGSNGLISSVSTVSHAVGYIAPDSAISAISNITRAYSDTNFAITIANGGSTTVYQVKDYHSSPTTGAAHSARTGNGSLTVPDIPSAGSTDSYMVVASLSSSNGGDGVGVHADTFTVTHNAATSPDTSISSIGNQTLSYSTSSASVTIGSGGSTTVYEARTSSYSGSVVGSRTSNGSISIPIPSAGSTTTYYLTGRVSTANQGTNATSNIQTFTITHNAATSPDTSISSIGNQTLSYSTSSASVTIGSGGSTTVYEARTGSYSGSVVGSRTSNGSISIPIPSAGSTTTYYLTGRVSTANQGTNATSNIQTFTITHNAATSPDTSISSIGNQTLLYSDSSASVTIGSGGSTTVYEARTGSYSGSVVGSRTSNGSMSVTIPSAGSTTTYYLTGRVSTANQGTNATSNIQTFTITHNALVSPDTSITTIANQTLEYSDTTTSVTISGGTSSTIYEVRTSSYSGSVVNSSTGNGTISISIPSEGTTTTYYLTGRVPTSSNGNNSASSIQTFTIFNPAQPDTSITAIADLTRPYGSTNFSITIANGGSTTVYEVKESNGTVQGSRTGNGTLTASDIPSAGSSKTYTVTGRIPAPTGNNSSSLADTFVVTQQAADTTPVAFSFTDVTTAALSTTYNTYVQITDIDIAVAVSISGSGTFSISSTTSPGSFGTSGSISNNQYLHVRQTSSSSYSSAANNVLNIGGVSDTWTITTIAVTNPDTSITDVSDIVSPNGSTNHSITIASGSSNTIYEVKTVSASGTVYGTGTGNGAITVSSIPSAGTSATYYITGRVTTGNGGDNTAATADTYTVLHQTAGGDSTGGGGTGTYGLRVFDAAGNTTLDLSDRVVTLTERVTGSLSSSETTKDVTLSAAGTAVINLDPITVIFVNNIPQRQQILYFSISGTTLTITRTATNATGSSNAAQAYDLLVVYDPE